MLRRETIIALRARHTAFRIAIDILYPPQPPPQLAQPAMPVLDLEGAQAEAAWEAEVRQLEERRQRQARWSRRCGMAFVMAWLIITLSALLYAFFADTTPPPPPPPQAHPILPAQP